MRTIYLLLTKTDTVLSKTIAMVTKDPYTHVAISLDKELSELYSFGRKGKYNPLNAGFVKEKFIGSVYESNLGCSCVLYEAKITRQQYKKLKAEIDEMLRTEEIYSYNLLGLIYHYFGYERKTDNKYFCSEFVSEMLRRIEMLPREYKPARMKPSDFMEMDGFRQVYSGTLGNLVEQS